MTRLPAANTARRRWLLAALSCPLAPAALAQATFPNRPVQLVVAAPAGGPSDTAARQLAEEMGRLLGQPMVVINRPGAGGVVAAESVARAPADGHTLMMSWIGNATSQALIPQQEFDINRDFVHVSQLLSGANVLVVHPSSGFRTLADLIRHAKAHPGQLSYASAGNGSSGHLAMEMLKQRAGVSMLHIPYRGGGPALMDLMSGRVQLMFNNQDVVLGPIQAGKLWPLAVSTPVRNPLYPQLPTVAESGFAGFEATAWAGVSGPKGLPPAVVDTLHSAIAKALQGPLRQKYESVGAQVVASTPEQFSQFVRRETEGWSAVIKKGGIRLD